MRGAGGVRRLRKPPSRSPGLKPVLGRACGSHPPAPRQGWSAFPRALSRTVCLTSPFDYVAEYMVFISHLV